MYKRIFSAFLSVCISLYIIPFFVCSAGSGTVLTYKNHGSYIEITGCDESLSGTLTIPAHIEELPVTQIGESAFAGCDGLTGFEIPSSVTEIGFGAFWDTAFYKDDDNWDNGVLYIDNFLIEGDCSFGGVYNIKEGTVLIADCAFEYHNITGVTIPDSVKYIGKYAFFYCENLHNVNVPASVTDIGEYAFGYRSDDDYGNTLFDGFIILCEKDSAAEGYAVESGIACSADYPNAYIMNDVVPTCTEDGYTGDLYDPDSNSIVIDGEVIPAYNHRDAYRVDVEAPAADEAGYTGDLYCPVCDGIIEEGETIPATGHENPQPVISAQRVDDTVVVLVSLPAVTRLEYCQISVEFDESVVSIDNLGSYAACDEDDQPYFTGTNLGGISAVDSSTVTQGFMTFSSVTKSTQTEFARFVFDIIDPEAVQAIFKVKVDQYKDSTTNISKADAYIYDIKAVTLYNHNNTFLKGYVDATCETTGYSGDMYSRITGKLIQKGEVIEKYDHIASDWIVDTEPTFHETGIRHNVCLRCGELLETQETDRVGLDGSDSNFVIILNSGYDFDLLACREDKSTAAQIKSQFTSDNIEIYDKDGVQLEDEDYIGTGCEVRLMDGETVIDTLVAVIMGDVNGDGIVNVNDARTVLRVAVELENFDDEWFAAIAADVTGTDGGIGIDDARKILRVAVELESFAS